MSETVLRYATTRADQVAKLQLYAGRSSAARWFPPTAYAVIVALAWLSAALFFVRQGDKNFLYVGSGLLALLLTLTLPWLYRRYQDQFFTSILTEDSLGGLVGPVELTIGDESLEEKGNRVSVRAGWRDVVAVERHDRRTFIFVAPLIAVVVPDRIFDSDSDLKAFIDLVRERFDRSRA